MEYWTEIIKKSQNDGPIYKWTYGLKDKETKWLIDRLNGSLTNWKTEKLMNWQNKRISLHAVKRNGTLTPPYMFHLDRGALGSTRVNLIVCSASLAFLCRAANLTSGKKNKSNKIWDQLRAINRSTETSMLLMSMLHGSSEIAKHTLPNA